MGVWSVHSGLGPGAVAQLGERRLCTAEVRGSNPLGSTLKSHCFAGKISDKVERATAGGVLVQQPCSNAESSLLR
jgi:hypothetical protein